MDLAALRVQTRYYLADDNNKRWSVAEVDSYINMAYGYYYDRLINVCYDGLVTTPVLLDMTSGTNTIDLPTDFYKAKILYRFYPSTSTGAIKKIPCYFKNNFENTQIITGLSGMFYRPSYSFLGQKLLLDPVPFQTIEEAFELVYYPIKANLVNTTDAPVNGFSTEWHQLIPLRAAMLAKLREEDDTTGIQSILSIQEQPFNNMLNVMSIARIRTEPFDSGGYILGSDY